MDQADQARQERELKEIAQLADLRNTHRLADSQQEPGQEAA